jgi:hypothetical protein
MHPITNKLPCLPHAGMSKNLKFQKNRFGHLVLVIGIYLGFVIWSLGFKIDLFWYYCLLDNRGRAIHK